MIFAETHFVPSCVIDQVHPCMVTSKTVLIVEDNELNMKIFNDLLQAYGFHTIQSRDGTNFLEMVRTHRPDLVLMDIQLPEISGIELTRSIKADEDLRNIPVIAVTAFALNGDEERIKSEGCDGYIAKPISVPDFLATINSFLA